MKTKEELNALKEEVESVNEKLAELTPEEIAQVTGGGVHARCVVFGQPGVIEPAVDETVSSNK